MPFVPLLVASVVEDRGRHRSGCPHHLGESVICGSGISDEMRYSHDTCHPIPLIGDPFIGGLIAMDVIGWPTMYSLDCVMHFPWRKWITAILYAAGG